MRSNPPSRNWRRLLAAFVLVFALVGQGCEPVSLTLFGVGASTGVGYTLNGYAYKTFTAPMPQVHDALLAALLRMGIMVKESSKDESRQIITATAADREIEIVLEAITDRATTIKTVARQGSLFKDRATATEIILQTEKALVGAR